MPDHQTWMRECVERARGGDREAFELLFEKFHDRLRSRVTARLGEALKRRLDVDDVLQETFLGALQSIPRYRWKGDESFYNWLASISENILRNWADRVGRDRRSALEIDTPISASPFSRLRNHCRGSTPLGFRHTGTSLRQFDMRTTTSTQPSSSRTYGQPTEPMEVFGPVTG